MVDTIDYKKLAVELLAAESGGKRTKDVGSTPTALYGHGPGGLFSTPGLNRPLFSAMILPRLGLQANLPIRPSMDTNPLFAIITGVTATSGSEPNGVCDDPPTVGTMKLCIHSYVYGRFSRMSKVYDIDRIGQITNRGEFTDLQIMNQPFSDSNNPNIPGMPGWSPEKAAQNEASKALFEMATAWSRDFAKYLYTGNPGNNTAGGGYKEFYGLESLVNTGYKDAETGQLCPAADSIVRDWGNLNIANNAAAMVRQLTNIYRNLRILAAKSGLSPVNWKMVMSYGLFYELTEVWPISFLTYRANAIPAGSTNFVDSATVEQMRQGMRGNLDTYEGQYLILDGVHVPVQLDDGIPETENGDGTFTSDIYFIPLTVLGGTPVTFMEYFDYSGPQGPLEFAKLFAPGDMYYISDNGRFLWHKKPPQNFCVQLLAKTEPRLLLLTPYLAARLTNVKYAEVYHERSPFTDSAYFSNGGRVEYPAPSLYMPTLTVR